MFSAGMLASFPVPFLSSSSCRTGNEVPMFCGEWMVAGSLGNIVNNPLTLRVKLEENYLIATMHYMCSWTWQFLLLVHTVNKVMYVMLSTTSCGAWTGSTTSCSIWKIHTPLVTIETRVRNVVCMLMCRFVLKIIKLSSPLHSHTHTQTRWPR